MPDERDAGFRHADIATDLLADPKVIRMVRQVPDEAEYAATIVVYLAAVLASWREGRRVSAAEAEGYVTATDERVQRLQAARLLDGDGKVPERSWERWNEPARRRVENKSKAGRAGAAARWQGKRPDGTAMTPHATGMADMAEHAQHSTVQNSAGAASAAHRAREKEVPTGDDEDAHLHAWYRVMASPPSPRVMPWLDDLAGQFGAGSVAQAIGAEAALDATRNTLLGRVQARLTTDSRHADREAARAKKEREAAAEAAFRERVESMPPEQRQANLARLADAMKGIGHGPVNGKEKAPRPSSATRTEHR